MNSLTQLFRRPWHHSSADVTFAACLLLFCGMSAIIGIAGPLGSYAHDTFFLLDNGYRVWQGQVPHRDFSSAWGPVIYLIEAAGLAISGLRPTSFGYANAMFGAAIGVWTFLIARPRWGQTSTWAIGAFAVLLVVGPFPIGCSPFDFGYAMSYNRYGYALCGVILIECAPRLLQRGAATNDRRGAVSTGTALALLAFLKVSFAAAMAPFIAVTLVGIGRQYLSRRLAFGALAFAATSILLLAYLRFDLADLLQDLLMAATSRRLSLKLLPALTIIDWLQIISLIGFSAVVTLAKGEADARIPRARAVLFVMMTLAVGYFLLITNQQSDSFPLNAYAALALAAICPPNSSIAPQWRRMVPLICVLPLGFFNAVSLSGAAVVAGWPSLIPSVPLALPQYGATMRFRLINGKVRTEVGGAEYVDVLNDGVDLLRRRTANDDGVMTIDEFNPFNYILHRRSPSGGYAAAAYNYLFCDAVHISPNRFFGDARYVMVRTYVIVGGGMEVEDISSMMRIYGPALQAEFTMVEQTPHWTLWRRKDV